MKLARAFFALFCLVWLTGATWLPLFKVASGGGLAVTWQASLAQDGGFGSPVNFASVPVGTASADRIVAVHLSSNFGGFTSVTICGTGATLSANDGASPPMTASYYANITSGTTCTIAVAGTGFNNVAISVYTITGATGGGAATPTSNLFSSNPNPGNPNQIAVTVAAGGKAIISAWAQNAASAGTPFTWTNTTVSGGDGAARATVGPNMIIASASATASATVTVTPTTITFGFADPILYQTWGP